MISSKRLCQLEVGIITEPNVHCRIIQRVGKKSQSLAIITRMELRHRQSPHSRCFPRIVDLLIEGIG